MSLYPTTVLDPVVASSLPSNDIKSGSLIVVPLDMTVAAMTELTLFQMSNTQDYSLRAWISKEKDGRALPFVNVMNKGIYPVMKFIGFPIVVFVAGQTPPPNTFGVEVEPGNYYLNILNLTNEGNIFGFKKADLT